MAGSLVGRLAGAVLGVVLLVAGAAKRADPGWPADATALGAPSWSIAPLPWVEMALGAVLIVGLVRPLAAGVAAVVLIAFTVLLVANLAHGRHPPCACFGSRTRRPIGAATVLRNVGLLGLAAVALVA